MTKPICFPCTSGSLQHIFDDRARVRLKALACRRLADLAEDAEREALWRKRASDWERLAKRVKKKLQPKSRPGL